MTLMVRNIRVIRVIRGSFAQFAKMLSKKERIRNPVAQKTQKDATACAFCG
jgi:hypothetical protein